MANTLKIIDLYFIIVQINHRLRFGMFSVLFCVCFFSFFYSLSLCSVFYFFSLRKCLYVCIWNPCVLSLCLTSCFLLYFYSLMARSYQRREKKNIIKATQIHFTSSNRKLFSFLFPSDLIWLGSASVFFYPPNLRSIYGMNSLTTLDLISTKRLMTLQLLLLHLRFRFTQKNFSSFLCRQNVLPIHNFHCINFRIKSSMQTFFQIHQASICGE